MTAEATFKLTHEIDVMRDLAKGTAEQHAINHDLNVIRST